MKLVGAVVQWFVILIMLVPIKLFIDAGIPVLVSLDVDDATISWVRLLPWLLPMAWFVGTIMWLVQPSKPKNPYGEPPKPPNIVRF